MKKPTSSEVLDQMLPFYGELHSFLRRQVASSDEASDLTQQTFLRIARWRQESSDIIEHKRGMLFRIARNLLVDRSRRRQRRSEIFQRDQLDKTEQAIDPVTPARLTEAQDQLERVKDAMANLPERCREVFALSRFGQLSYAQISDRLGISRSTVEKHMIKALAACKKALD